MSIVSVTSLTCVQPCSGCSRVLCQTGGGWLERAGAASHKSLSSPLSASRAGAGVDLCYQLNNANVLYRGALIKLLTSNTTEFIFTVLKIQIWLLLKYRCCKKYFNKMQREIYYYFVIRCTVKCTNLRQQVAALLSVHSLIFYSFPLSFPRSRLPWLLLLLVLTTSILLLSSSNFLPFLLDLPECPRPQIPKSWVLSPLGLTSTWSVWRPTPSTHEDLNFSHPQDFLKMFCTLLFVQVDGSNNEMPYKLP